MHERAQHPVLRWPCAWRGRMAGEPRLLLEEGVRADLALLHIGGVVRRLAGQCHVPVVEAWDPFEVLLCVCLVVHRLEHLLHILRLVTLLQAVLIISDKDAYVVALIVLVLALTQADHSGGLAGREVHHVLEFEVGQLILEFVRVVRPEAFAAEVRHHETTMKSRS